MKKLLLISGLLAVSLFLTSCFDPIFYEINNDVAPEESSVTGIIRSLARYTVAEQEFIVTTANGGIRYKPVDITGEKYSEHGNWKTFNCLPEGFESHKYDYYGAENHTGQEMLKIVADSTNLYLLTTSYKNNPDVGTAIPDKVHLYTINISELEEDGITWKNSEWTEVLLLDSEGNSIDYLRTFSYNDYQYSAFNLFSTNSVQSKNRKAFVRSGGTSAYEVFVSDEERTQKYIEYLTPVYYQLSGSTLIPVTGTTAFDLIEDDEDSVNASKYYGYNSAVWFNNQVLFFDSSASVTNETFTSDASIVYFGVGSDLYYNTTFGTTKSDVSSGSAPISCLEVCSDSLLIGRGNFNSSSSSASGGIAKTSLNDGIPGSELIPFNTNAEIKLKTAYFILTLLNENPAKTEEESNLFSSICFLGTGSSSSAVFGNIGLWSYYPSRGNWNCE